MCGFLQCVILLYIMYSTCCLTLSRTADFVVLEECSTPYFLTFNTRKCGVVIRLVPSVCVCSGSNV